MRTTLHRLLIILIFTGSHFNRSALDTLGFVVRENGSESAADDQIKLPKKEITIAVLTDISSDLYSTTGYENLAAAQLAIDDINANTTFLPDYHFKMKLRNDGCDREIGLKAISKVYAEGEKIYAIIGISCSVVCELAGYLCADDQWNIPVVSHSCSSDDLSDAETFPTFSRLALSVYKYIDAIIEVCKEFKWEKVGIMATNIDWYVRTANKMKAKMEKNDVYNIKVFLEKFYNSDDPKEQKEGSDTYRLIREQLERMKKNVRVVIIVGLAQDIIFVLTNSAKLGMNNGHFAFLTQEFIQADLDKNDEKLMQAINGVLDFEPFLNKSELGYRSFSERVRDIVEEKSFPETGKDVANLVAAQMYDAVYLYAYALEEAVLTGQSIENGRELVKLMTNMRWTGKSGEIRIDKVGDRLGNVQILNVQNGNFKQVGTWWMSKNEHLQLAADQDNQSQIIWPGRPGTPPVACGRQYELCQTHSDAVARITLLALVCMAFLFGILVRLYIYNRTNK